MRILFALLIMLGALAAGPGAALARDTSPPPQPSEDEPPAGRPAAWDVVDGPSTLAPASAGASAASQASAPSDCLGAPARAIRYTSDGVIHLEGCGQVFHLSDIPAAGIGADKLELSDAANKIWLLKVKLKVEEGARLEIAGGAGGDAAWLRLLSTSASGVWLRADNASLLFQNTKVTSWDPARNAPDDDPAVAADGSGGRAYIATRSVLTKGRATAAPSACAVNGGSREPYEGRMDVVNSELGYLGYYAGESYGVVWKVYYKVNAADPADAPPPGRQLYAQADVFGDVSGSSFHHNYFGSYTFGAYCMNWTGNTFANNVMYGLDPHDDSDYLTIAGNVFHDNGDHGVICSVECDHLVIRDNQSYRNQHGIMLHRNVNGALVEGNISRDNRGAGIAIFDSHDAVVRNNTVTGNGEAAVRLSVGASRNLIENNTLAGAAAGGAGPGYAIYTFKGSDAPTAGDGLPKNNTFRANRLAGSQHPLVKLGEATANIFERNTIAGPASDLAFSQAPGNIIRDSPFGQPLQIALDSASSVMLEDSRGAAWLIAPTGPGATATAGGSMLNLTYQNAGAGIAVTPIDLVVRPAAGAVAVQPSAWAAGHYTWTERASGAVGVVPHSVGGLAIGGCYTVVAGGAAIGNLRADATGRIAFSFAAYAGATDFVVAACAGSAAPQQRVFLPLVRR